MIEKLNRLKKRLAQVKAGPAAIALKSAGLGDVLTDVEGLVEDLVNQVIDQRDKLELLANVVDELVMEQGAGVVDGA